MPDTVLPHWRGCRELDARFNAAEESLPLYCLDLRIIEHQAKVITVHLPTPYYAVKANSHPATLAALAGAGVTRFDVASITELRQVRAVLPDAICAYMNPIKTAADIRDAVALGVRDFVLDSADHAALLLAITPADACLIVRLALVADGQALYDMRGKFGADPGEAIALLRAIAASGRATGLTFHVGSQCLQPLAFSKAIDYAADIAHQAGVPLAVLDVGGGFPTDYTGDEASLAAFGQAIRSTFAQHATLFGPNIELRSEPGRCVVAAAGSVAVQILARKGQLLFLNDGRHGLLSELVWMPRLHPIRQLGACGDAALAEFSLAGPSCDSGDFFPGPYHLPAMAAPGDWLEIGYLGAYALELNTCFNGYGHHKIIIVRGQQA